MTLVTILGVCAVLIAFNAIFVAAEFALLASPRPTLEHRASLGDRVARRMLEVVESPQRQDRYVATAQLGITAASLGLGMYGEHELSALLAPGLEHVPLVGGAALAATVAVGLLTIVHIVFGEMVPKGLALKSPVGMSRLTQWPMLLTLVLLFPLVAASGALARLCLRLLGVRREANTAEQVYTPEELQLIVDESQRGGALQAESGRILHELFEFGDLNAAQVMVPRVRVAGIPLSATANDLRAIALRYRRTRYAVYDGDLDHIVGTLHARDILRLITTNAPVTADDVRKIPVVPETASLDDVLAAMQQAGAHMSLVIDEHGGTAGIISLEDLFEEVVGELDEGAPSTPPLVALGDGTVRVAGTMRLGELGQHLGLDLEHEEVESVSGLVLERLGRPPAVGDVVDYGRLKVEVTATSGRGVREVRVSVTPETVEEE